MDFMTTRDGHDREMAKWSHHRTALARQRAEDEQREALTDLDQLASSRQSVVRVRADHDASTTVPIR
jgi:hypothetical protein